MIGHSYAAAGVLDTITGLMALQQCLIPPTINCEELDPRYDLQLVRDEAQSFTGSAILIGGRGLGGANVVLAYASHERHSRDCRGWPNGTGGG